MYRYDMILGILNSYQAGFLVLVCTKRKTEEEHIMCGEVSRARRRKCVEVKPHLMRWMVGKNELIYFQPSILLTGRRCKWQKKDSHRAGRE